MININIYRLKYVNGGRKIYKHNLRDYVKPYIVCFIIYYFNI